MSHIQEYKNETDNFISTLNEQISQLHTTINNKIQKDVMNLIGEDLYNYSNIETYEIDDIINYYKSKSFLNIANDIEINKNKIVKEDGEKIIIYFTERTSQNYSYDTYYMISIIVTNYGTIYKKTIRNCSDKCYNLDAFIKNYEYWIPIDYINIIRSLVCNKIFFKYKDNHYIMTCNKSCYCTSCIKSTSFEDGFLLNILQTILENIKDNLYNGLYVKNNVDIHFMDVYREKQKLLEDQEIFEIYKNTKEIELETEKYNLEEEKKKLEEDRRTFEIKKNQLKRISKKLKIEQQNIDKQKEEIENLLLNNTATDELFDMLEEEVTNENIRNDSESENEFIDTKSIKEKIN